MQPAIRSALVLHAALALCAACGDDDAARPSATMADVRPPRTRDMTIALAPMRMHPDEPPDPAEGKARDAAPRPPAAHDGGSDAGHGMDAAVPVDPVLARGEYLVRHVAGCMECHSPRKPSGKFDESKLLAGVENLADVEPDDDARGLLHSRNLTPDEETGLGRWSDAQIKRAFQQGFDKDDRPLHWLMPYWIFANMTDQDADAIVAFLRALPKIVHTVPDAQPNAIEGLAPYQLPLADVPWSTLPASDPNFESALRGRYLAIGVAPCMLCHSPPLEGDPTVPLDIARVFAGKRKIAALKLGTGLPPDAPIIESFNLTPHANGLGQSTPSQVAATLISGIGPAGLPVCDPMPSYYGGSFTGMQQQDALDLGSYFTSLPPIDTGVIEPCCTACHRRMDADGGD